MLKSENFANKNEKDLELNEKELQKQQKNIKRNFIAICLGSVLLLCGYSASFVLQSSVNIKAGLGSKAVTATYFTSMICCLFVAPFFLRLFGIKKVMISSECCYVLYVCANIYPEPAIVIIGGVLAGYAEGLYWVTLFIIFVYFGNVYHKYSHKSVADCVMQFCGLGFGIIQINQVVGNLSTFLIFHFLGTETKNSTQGQDSFNTSDSNNISQNSHSYNGTITPSVSSGRSLANCGLNDCQDPNITSRDIEQYVPQDPVVIYVMIGCLIVMMLCGILLHVCLMDDIPLDILNSQQNAMNKCNAITDPQELQKLSLDNDDKSQNEFEDNVKKQSLKEIWIISSKAWKATFSQLIKGSQWLITPITIGYGFSSAFLYSEATRAFASCILGVSQVGISICCYSIGFMICCAIIGKVCVKCGIIPMIILAYLFHMINFVGYLVWKPSLQYSWIIYCFFALYGIVNALWSIILNSVYGSNAYQSKEISLNVFNSLAAAGMCLQYGISTILCVRQKVFLVIFSITFGSILFGIREIRKNAMKHEE